MEMKPFYIHHVKGENGVTGEQLSRGFDLNYGRDEMTSGGQREHNVDVLEENLRSKGLNPEDFAFYTDGFRFEHPSRWLGPWCCSTLDGLDRISKRT